MLRHGTFSPDLSKKAGAKKDVTKSQVKRSARRKASARTICRRFKEKKVKFGPYKERGSVGIDAAGGTGRRRSGDGGTGARGAGSRLPRLRMVT